jgi:HAE1 family hydrophobic/amphiphilic exporter-1
MMTTLTTVLGLAPMAMGLGEGSEMRTPMAITVIGGLLTSTMLTLLVVPVMYSLLDRRSDVQKKENLEVITPGPGEPGTGPDQQIHTSSVPA